MTNITINNLPLASTIDATLDFLPIYTASSLATQRINRNTLLGLSSAPVGLSDSQTLTNKAITSPTISNPTFSGTLSGTYTIGGTPTFPASLVTLNGSQTLTNKVLTSPTINTPTITNATISADTLSGFSASTNGTVYGMSVTSGILASAAIANAVNTAAIQSAAVTPVKWTNPYKFAAYHNTTQAITTAGATVAFNTEDYDSNSNFASNTYTAPVNGFYVFAAGTSWAATGSQTRGILTLALSAGNNKILGDVSTAAAAFGVNGYAEVQLTAGTTVTVSFQPVGATTTLRTGPTTTYFMGHLTSIT